MLRQRWSKATRWAPPLRGFRRASRFAVILVLLGSSMIGSTEARARAETDQSSASDDADDMLAAQLRRFYLGFLEREPEPQGFRSWHCLVSRGRAGLGTVADSFIASEEFTTRYGRLSDVDFVDLAYQRLFDRQPDRSGRSYWLGRLSGGLTQGRMMASLTESDEFRTSTADGVPPTLDSTQTNGDTCGPILLTWISRGLPAGFSDRVTDLPEITASTTVLGDLLRLVETRNEAGAIVDRAGAGWAWPIDAFAVDPASFATFTVGPDAERIRELQPGQAILTQTSSRLRRIGVGGVLHFAGGSVTVVGVVDDRSGGAAEIVLHRDDGSRLGVRKERYLLLRTSDRGAAEAGIRRHVPSGSHLSLRGSADTRFLRSADRVAPQAHVKASFGEFTFRDTGGRGIAIDPAWVSANIATESVPLLGRITCHRAILPRVRAALAEVRDRGAGGSVDPSRFSGCYAPRRIQAGEGLSYHSWGIALDINIGANPRGDYRTQSSILVQALTGRSFNWGGTWEFPDPGHYESKAS